MVFLFLTLIQGPVPCRSRTSAAPPCSRVAVFIPGMPDSRFQHNVINTGYTSVTRGFTRGSLTLTHPCQAF